MQQSSMSPTRMMHDKGQAFPHCQVKKITRNVAFQGIGTTSPSVCPSWNATQHNEGVHKSQQSKFHKFLSFLIMVHWDSLSHH